MARKPVVSVALGQQLLESKLQVLTGTGGRRPSLALSILTGDVPEPLPFPRAALVDSYPPPRPARRTRQYTRRTVYLADRHLRDLDALLSALQPAAGRRLTRSAVLRQAIDHLRADVLTHPEHTAAQPLPEHDEHA
jgi:hypothetical protein